MISGDDPDKITEETEEQLANEEQQQQQQQQQPVQREKPSSARASLSHEPSEDASMTLKSTPSIARDAEDDEDVTTIMVTHLSMDKLEIGSIFFLAVNVF